MRLDEIISPPLLYHGAPLLNLLGIIKDNFIQGSENTNFKEPYGVRCSRYANVANDFTTRFDFGFGGGILVLDRTKLAQRYKIVCHDDGQDKPEWRRCESEEIVIGDIRPLEPYLVRIDIKPRVIERLLKRNDYWSELWWDNRKQYREDRERLPREVQELLVNHPKFNPVTKPYLKRLLPVKK